uniref:Uncharacterized protein n=1 Tax=Arcella intermedia TaxID=1963864 RepID=A0A6B2LBF8_9EUKA
MATYGAHVIMACRDPKRADAAIQDLTLKVPNGSFEFLRLDLSDWDSIVAFHKELKEKHEKVHILVNNAAVVMDKYEKGKQGRELMMSVNYLGTVLLTQLMMDVLGNAASDVNPRVVFVASNAHTLADKLDVKSLDEPEEEPKKGWSISESMAKYGRTKQCLLLYLLHLNKQLRADNSKILVYGADPGWVSTELGRAADDKFYSGIIKTLEFFTAKPPEDGCISSVYAATSPDLESVNYSGQYLEGVRKAANWHKDCKDEALAAQLSEWTTNVLKPYFQ